MFVRPTGLVARPPISCSWPVHGHRWLTRHLIPLPFHTRLHLQNMPTHMSSDRGAVASGSCATARRYRYALATWPIGTLVATGICDFKSATRSTARAGRASGQRGGGGVRGNLIWISRGIYAGMYAECAFLPTDQSVAPLRSEDGGQRNKSLLLLRIMQYTPTHGPRHVRATPERAFVTQRLCARSGLCC